MKNLGKKILAVMQAVQSVEKDGYNAFHKYKYTTDAAIVTKIREELIKNNLIVVPSQEACTQNGEITTLKLQYTLIDIDSGEQMMTQVYGQGQDKGDKGVYKAATGAEKYYLLKTFLIPTDDDPESTNGKNDSLVKARPQVTLPKPEPTFDTDALEDYVPEEDVNQEPPVNIEPLEPAHFPKRQPFEQKPNCISEKQAKRFYAIAKNAHHSDASIKAFLRERIGSDRTSDIPWKKYEALCEEIAK